MPCRFRKRFACPFCKSNDTVVTFMRKGSDPNVKISFISITNNEQKKIELDACLECGKFFKVN